MIYIMGTRRDGIVKIGTAVDPVSRLRQVQAGHPEPLEVLLSLPGGRVEEQWLHKRFADLRVSAREWFDFDGNDAVTAVVAALAVREQAGELGLDLTAEEDDAAPGFMDPRRRRAAPCLEDRPGRGAVPVYILPREDGGDVGRGLLIAWRRDADGYWIGWVCVSEEAGTSIPLRYQYIGAGALLPAPA